MRFRGDWGKLESYRINPDGRLVQDYPIDIKNQLLKFFDYEKLISILRALEKPSKQYTFRTNTLKISTEKLYSKLLEKNLNVKLHSKLDEALTIPIEGPFEIEVEGGIVVANKYAAESVYQGSHLYAPGVISAEGVEKGKKVTVIDEQGLPIAVGIAVMDGKEMVKLKRGLAVKIERSIYKSISLRELEEYEQGLIYEQSVPAILTSLILNPSPGDIILDMCAAPGGKTSHMAQLMGNMGRIYAFEKSKLRYLKLKENLMRMGVKCAFPLLEDSRYVDLKYPQLKVDKILIDPPCSALGVRPKLFERRTLRDVLSLMQYQIQFFKAAVKVIGEGGIIVYSTCTITPHENELIVEKVLEKFPLELDWQSIHIGSTGLNIIDGNRLLQRFYPDEHDTPGYFIARFVKV